MAGTRKTLLLGSGGHARVLLETMKTAGLRPPAAVLTADRGLHGGEFNGIPVIGDDDALGRLVHEGFDSFVLGIGSAADTALRVTAWQRACAAGLAAVMVIHPTAIICPTARLGEGIQLLPRSVVHSAAELDDNVIINTGAIVEHDCRVGPGSHIATGAILCGGVTVGKGAHVGAGAVVRQGITIGEGALVGAGAVVVRDVDAGARVVGCPARPLLPGQKR